MFIRAEVLATGEEDVHIVANTISHKGNELVRSLVAVEGVLSDRRAGMAGAPEIPKLTRCIESFYTVRNPVDIQTRPTPRPALVVHDNPERPGDTVRAMLAKRARA